MKSGLAAVMVSATLLTVGCYDSPSNGTSTPGLRNNLVPVGTTGEVAPAGAAEAAPVSTSVNCGVNRQAVIRRVQLDGRTVEQIDCVAAASPAPAPAAAAAPAAAERAPAARRAASSQRVRADARQRDKRSWKESAVVIGGSSAAGAGIGALIGGKKGALIGAAAGGGAGTVYDIKKRKDD